MKHLGFMAVVLASACMVQSAQAGTPTYYDTSYNSALGTMNYRVYLPANYNASGAKIPVLLYLHSAAERGDTVADVFQSYNNWATQIVSETQSVNSTHQAVLIIPQSGWWQTWAKVNNGDNWGAGNYTNATAGTIDSRLQLALDIVDKVVAEKNVDANRQYITGASMGGYGTWDAISRYPNKFAAAAPIAGGGNLTAAATTLTDMPIWSGHGAADPLISVNNDDALYNTLNANGGDPIYSRISGGDHGDWWDEFYTNDYYTTASPSAYAGSGTGLYDWMFAQSLAPVPEPGSMMVLAGAGLGLLMRRRMA